MRINIVRPTRVWHPEVFDELCDLLVYSFVELGYRTKVQFDKFENLDLNIFISLYFSNDLLTSAPEGSIIFQIENLRGESEYFKKSRQRASIYAKNFEFWDYSLANVEILKSMGAPNAKYFEFGFCKGLERYTPRKIADRTNDVVFCGHLNDHRKFILSEMKNLGLRVQTLNNLYGPERDGVILNSKAVLNLHSEGSNFEIVRVHYPLNNGMLVISEVNLETSISENYSKYIVPFDAREMADNTFKLLSNMEELNTISYLNFQKFKESSSVELVRRLLC